MFDAPSHVTPAPLWPPPAWHWNVGPRRLQSGPQPHRLLPGGPQAPSAEPHLAVSSLPGARRGWRAGATLGPPVPMPTPGRVPPVTNGQAARSEGLARPGTPGGNGVQARALSLFHLGPEEEGVSGGRRYFLGPISSPQNRGGDEATRAAAAGRVRTPGPWQVLAEGRTLRRLGLPSHRRGARQVVPEILVAGSARLLRGNIPLSHR